MNGNRSLVGSTTPPKTAIEARSSTSAAQRSSTAGDRANDVARGEDSGQVPELDDEQASAVVHDQDGAVGPVCDSLADASDGAEAVQAARADDDEVRPP